jgi:hypothetical protein
MMADGYLVGDGSWNLRVYVTDLQVERTLRVKGDLHIGGVMLKLVEDLGKLKRMENFGSLAKIEWFQHCFICTDYPISIFTRRKHTGDTVFLTFTCVNA